MSSNLHEDGGSGSSLKARANDLARLCEANPKLTATTDSGEDNARRAIIDAALTGRTWGRQNGEGLSRLERALGLDGYCLVPSVADLKAESAVAPWRRTSKNTRVQVVRKTTGDESASEAEALTDLHQRLDDAGWTSTLRCLKHALENHTRGNWRSGNADVRPFLEGLLKDLAIKTANGMPPAWSTLQAREIQVECWRILKNAGRLNDDEVKYGKALWRLLHLEGPHHGLSTESTASFRIDAVLAFARLLLRRDMNPNEKQG